MIVHWRSNSLYDIARTVRLAFLSLSLLVALPSFAADKLQPRTYEASERVVYQNCIEALGRLGWNITGFDTENGFITAVTGVNASTFGDTINVVLTPMTDGKTKVVLSSRTPNQMITWGKNKRNKKKFYKTLDEVMEETVSSEISSDFNRVDESTDTARVLSTGSGFFITPEGHMVTNYHVVKDSRTIEVYVLGQKFGAKVISSDKNNDIALLLVDGNHKPLPIAESQYVQIGSGVFTVGFPNPTMQGLNPKFTRGDINSLTGFQDDIRFFQTSVQIQPGNSGGPLVDMHGNVVGVTTSTLGALWAIEHTGSIPQNVNYAIKSNYVLALLKNFSTIYGQLKSPNSTSEIEQTELVSRVSESTGLIVTY